MKGNIYFNLRVFGVTINKCEEVMNKTKCLWRNGKLLLGGFM